MKKDKPSLRRLAARHLIFYALDMGVAIVGWYYQEGGVA